MVFGKLWLTITVPCGHSGIRVVGYEGDLRTQKRKFIDIKRNSIPYKELTSKEEIELYPTIKEEILSLPHKGANTHALMASNETL